MEKDFRLPSFPPQLGEVRMHGIASVYELSAVIGLAPMTSRLASCPAPLAIMLLGIAFLENPATASPRAAPASAPSQSTVFWRSSARIWATASHALPNITPSPAAPTPTAARFRPNACLTQRFRSRTVILTGCVPDTNDSLELWRREDRGKSRQ